MTAELYYVRNIKNNTNPLLNFLKGGLMTAPLLIIQNLPVLTLAKSPLMMASLWTITLPCSTIFWDPHRTVCLLTLLPEAYKHQWLMPHLTRAPLSIATRLGSVDRRVKVGAVGRDLSVRVLKSVEEAQITERRKNRCKTILQTY